MTNKNEGRILGEWIKDAVRKIEVPEHFLSHRKENLGSSLGKNCLLGSEINLNSEGSQAIERR